MQRFTEEKNLSRRLRAASSSECATSAVGPSRHFAATQHFSRFRGEADIGNCTRLRDSDANDPTRTSLASFAPLPDSAPDPLD